ncbi:uncharacterized protein LOC125226995 [Leguminivora glycinivorella]|uniref:uncharacterized protein LOC125226995 n=1 Tax=Leguminivora glycinivorella TaxID=1035111 RepID=UPI00200C6DCC|nr:uncharacterized protein LOC125226995 [Leguminivora glycinivorella]
MRRKSERTASKKAKPSPEKKTAEKAKKTRTSRRRKQSNSSEESGEDASPVREAEATPVVEQETKPPQTPTKEKEVSPEDAHEVWHVKAAETPSDTGEIQKLKICLTRPPSTPERVDRSPRSRRKHSRATSSSDTPSVEGVEDRKKSKHRSKRSARESKDESEKNQDSQGDEADSETPSESKNRKISQSSGAAGDTVPDETPMSTTSEDKVNESDNPTASDQSHTEVHSKESDAEGKTSDADTTVASPRDEAKGNQLEDSKQCDKKNSPKSESTETSQESDKADERKVTTQSTESKADKTETQEQSDGSQEKEETPSEHEVSKSEDSSNNSKNEEAESSQNESSKAINDNDVVDSSEKVKKKQRQSASPEPEKERRVDHGTEINNSRDLERSDSTQSQEEPIHNGQAAPIVVSRKRRWGSRPSKLTTQKSITISTDVLKDIIPDVKPAEFEEVIEEKKHKRVQSNEKVDRPILPKIVIDNTDHMEHHKKEYEEREPENLKFREPLSANRRISIVKDDSIIARPLSPPRNKQSCILYISNLVRPFTLPQLKNLLQRTGRISEDGFWIDRIKSRCFVKYETEDQAVETRHALHGVTWPVSNPKTLQVDFSSQEAFDKAKANEDTDNAQTTTIPGTVEDWLREQDMKRERGDLEKPWERKAAAVREWDFGKNEKDKDKDRPKRDERILDKRRHRTPERSPEPARKFKKKEEEAPAKLLDDLFRKTKATPCIYWLPLSAEMIAIKEEQRRQHMAEHERRMQELRRTHRRHYGGILNNTMGLVTWCCAAALLSVAAAQFPITIEEWLRGDFTQRGFRGTWISDTEFTYVIAGEPGIYVYDASIQESRVLVSGELMAFLNTSSPILSADREYILAPSDVEEVYRYSTTARFALYHIASQQVTYVADHQRLQLCIFGGGHSLAYVLDNNLYYLPENSDQAIQLTDDGIPGVIYNGHSDWVYEEDVMYTGQATWFNPTGSHLAFASYDDTDVGTYSYYYFVDKTDPEDLYPELFHLKYPKVGDTNPTVRLRVINLERLVQDGVWEWQTLAAPEVVTDDHILGGVVWPTAYEIAAHWLNRRQNYTVLRICNVQTGLCPEEEHRQQPNGWVPIVLSRFSSAGDFYVSTRWSLEQADGNIWQHLYVSMRINGEIVSSSITPGAFTVNNFVGMDESTLSYYFTRTVTDSPWQSQVHAVGAQARCLSCELVMPEGGPCTWATATASLQAAYMTVTCSSPEEPSATFIINPRTGAVLETWEDNQRVRDNFLGRDRPQSIITTVPLQNGFPAPVRLFLPPGLDVNDTDTKYPCVFYVYSGPNTNTVFDTFTVGYHTYLTTNRNTIYMLADGRGSGLKGQDILYSLNNALGTVEIEDHFVILREVLARYHFIDPARVGIWGHSYGGYATLLTLIHDDNHEFACGISTAPVTSWLYYNTMYTERYMGVPTAEDNLAGYQAGDVTLMAERLRGKNLLLMHGNADDNVHFQNAAKLMRALQELDIDFDQMSYPDEAHSLEGVGLHRYNAMNAYWEKCLRL